MYKYQTNIPIATFPFFFLIALAHSYAVSNHVIWHTSPPDLATSTSNYMQIYLLYFA
jgi:hypothetical protein